MHLAMLQTCQKATVIRRKGGVDRQTQNELKLLSGSWTQQVKNNIVNDAIIWTICTEMEIGENYEDEEQDENLSNQSLPQSSIWPKARRPTQSPNKARRK